MCTAYKCRAYPDPDQANMLNRTFGCVRVAWNRTLAWRQARYRDGAAFSSFFAGRARYPRYKSRTGRQSAEYTRSGFRYRDGQKGSANRAKARAKVARAHRKVRASRADFLHRTSTRLVRDHGVIVIEDLAVNNMVRNHSLARAISDCSWGEFRRQLQYKAARAGRHLIVIDRFYPSSKTCSACGHQLAELPLRTRAWRCPSCGTRHDRDVNAAKNILAAGLAVTACGADVRHSGSSRVRSAVKQEPRRATTGIPALQGGE